MSASERLSPFEWSRTLDHNPSNALHIMGRFARALDVSTSVSLSANRNALAGPMGTTAVEPMHNASVYPQIVQPRQHESRANALSHAASKRRIGAVIFRDELTVHGRIRPSATPSLPTA